MAIIMMIVVHIEELQTKVTRTGKKKVVKFNLCGHMLKRNDDVIAI